MKTEELRERVRAMLEEAKARKDATEDDDSTRRFWSGRFHSLVDVTNLLNDLAPSPPRPPWVYQPKPGDEEKEIAFHVKVEMHIKKIEVGSISMGERSVMTVNGPAGEGKDGSA